jgi:uncharacterized protein YndB with AHSA1/START domain
MSKSSTDRIEKRIELQAPLARVWRAITDHREFGQWFRVNLETPFRPGEVTRGRIAYPGYEHLIMEVTAQKMEPERLFSYTWHPYAVDAGVDYSQEPSTLVEFTLSPIAGGTLLIVTESGFDAIPAARRDEAFRMDDRGWTEQMHNIEKYVNDHP